MKLLILLLFLLCNFSYSKKPAFILYDDGTWEKVEGMKNSDNKSSNIRPEFIPIHNLLLSLLSKNKIKLKESFSKKINHKEKYCYQKSIESCKKNCKESS